jgi:hypothetical protein
MKQTLSAACEQTLSAACVCVMLLAAGGAHAQQRERATPPGGDAPANCTDVQVGSAQSYDCINAQLGAVARGTQRFSSDADAPITASSPSNQVGTFNESATRMRLGPNFGKSVQPYRPAYVPPPTIASPR